MRAAFFRRRGALLSGIVALFAVALACENTPIDAVIADEVRGDGGTAGAAGTAGTAGMAGDAATCTTTRADPGPGRYRIFSSTTGRCLGAGAPTTVLGRPAFTTQTSTDCGGDSELWELEPVPLGTAFRLRNVALGLYLDVERGMELNGTRVLLYDGNMLPNQVFSFRPRANAEFEIAPDNAVASCVSDLPVGVEIWSCSAANVRQNWETFLATCP